MGDGQDEHLERPVRGGEEGAVAGVVGGGGVAAALVVYSGFARFGAGDGLDGEEAVGDGAVHGPGRAV